MHVRKYVRPSVLIFSVFSATTYPIDTNFSPTHVECFNDNYDVIGQVMWQPCWTKEKLWTSVAPKLLKGLVTWCGSYDFIFFEE